MPRPPETPPPGHSKPDLLLRHFSEEVLAGSPGTKPSILELLLGQGDIKKRNAEVKNKAKDKAQAAKRDPDAIKRELEAKQARAKGLPEGAALTEELLQARNMIEKVHGASAFMDPNHVKALPDAAVLAVNLALLPNDLRTPEVLLAMWTDFAADIPLSSLTAQARQEYYDMQRVVRKAVTDAARYNPGSAIAPDILDKVLPEEFSLTPADLIDLAKPSDAIDRARSLRTPRGRDLSSAFKADSPDWIYDKDEHGKKILLQDETDASGNVVRSLQPVRDALEQLEDTWHINDVDGVNAQAKILEDVVNDPKNRITHQDVRPYYNKLKEHMKVLTGDHWRPTSEEMNEIRDDWRARDRIFFERINNVLQNDFEQSRQVMNLYKEAGVDIFIDAVREAMGPKGDEWASHYEHLKQSIFFNHDVEQVARSALGDVEVLQKLVGISHTSYMLEATQDPIVEAMAASLEQALIQILQDHDGHLPPDLFSLRLGKKVYWNELAMQIFKTKVESNVVRDYKRNPDGSPVPKDNSIGYQLGKVFTIDDFNDQKKRIDATMQLAKGVGVFDHRLLELFASAKAPGFETRDTVFSSIPYEGIARFFRPTAHLFGKYKMGELAHKAVFATLIGGRMPDVVNLAKWSPEDYIHVSDAVANGTLSDWLKKKYGEKLGGKLYTEVTPFIEIMEDTMWSGRVGPHSTWGEHDATLHFTDLQRELEGGSIRLGRAQWWASRAVQGEYMATHPPEEWSKWSDLQHTREYKTKIDNLKKAYSTWVWAQMTLRNPKAVAENVFMTPNGIQLENKSGTSLRTQLIEEILHINLAREVSTEATPNQSQRNKMARIAILESDIAAIQHAALYGGPNGEPREIKKEDYDRIIGDKVIDGTGERIIERIRREQAQRYIEAVRDRVLGSQWKTEKDVKQALGITVSSAEVPDNVGKNIYTLNDMLHFANVNNIDDFLGDGDKKIGEIQRNGGRLTQNLINRKQSIYMNQADTRKGDLDIGNLGERAYARLTNDLLARKEAISHMQELLGEFGPKMGEKIVLTLIKKMYTAEKAGRGPDDSAKAFVYYYARLYGEFYRGHWAGKLPFLGQVLRRFGPPLSVAQSVYNKKTGDVWSINNENHWIDQIDGLGVLPYNEVEPNGKVNKYSIQRLQRELVGGNKAALAEMVFIGIFLAAMVVSFSAVTKQIEEEKN